MSKRRVIEKVKQIGPLRYVKYKGVYGISVEGIEEVLKSLKFCPICKGKLTLWGKTMPWGKKDQKNKRCPKCGVNFYMHVVS